MTNVNIDTLECSELVLQTFDFWFQSHEHIRTPFPEYILDELKEKSLLKFSRWLKNLKDETKQEMEDEALCVHFEEIIFETALGLVKTEDEKITIRYPFLPRLNDIFYENATLQIGASVVISRNIIRVGDVQSLNLVLNKVDTQELWNTKFELPL